MVVIVAMQMDKLPYLSPISRYTAYFDDAGGSVTRRHRDGLFGVKVGTVENIVLAPTDQGTKASVTFRMNDTVVMGTDTQAVIKTETVLGRRNLDDSAARRWTDPGPGESIANRNTIAPYSLSDALDESTTSLAQTDTDQLNKALDTLSATPSSTPDEVQGAVDGVTAVQGDCRPRQQPSCTAGQGQRCHRRSVIEQADQSASRGRQFACRRTAVPTHRHRAAHQWHRNVAGRSPDSSRRTTNNCGLH